MTLSPAPQLKAARRFSWSRLSVEYRMVIPFAILWLCGLLAGLPINKPSASVAVRMFFGGPMLLAGALQMIFLLVYARRSAREGQSKRLIVQSILLVLIATFLYFNFKAWMPFIHPRLYDPELQRADLLLEPLLTAILRLRQSIADLMPISVDPWYSLFYYLMFLVSLTVHPIFDTTTNYRRVVLGLCFIMLFGGISYWIMPALGPYLYRPSLNEAIHSSQQYMRDVFIFVRETHTYPPGYFVAPPAAMPSLHTAHAVYFTFWAARSARKLLVLYIPITFWIMIEAVASGFHYILDLPAGIAVAALAIVVARRLIPAARPERSEQL